MKLLGHKIKEVVDNPHLGNLYVFASAPLELVDKVWNSEIKVIYADILAGAWYRLKDFDDVKEYWSTSIDFVEFLQSSNYTIGISLPTKTILRDILQEL